MQEQAPPESFVVTISQTPADEVSLADVIFGSLGLTGALVALALVLGLAVAAIRVRWNRSHPPESDHLPPVARL